MSSAARNRTRGFSLVELAVVLGLVGILAALAAPLTTGWSDRQRLRDSARTVANAFSYARGEAIRTGNIHAVFFQTDAGGTALASDLVVLDDGLPGSATQNCDIDAGETVVEFSLEKGVSPGVTHATAKVPTDPGAGALGASTFEDAGGNAASWVLFRPEGMPLAFSSDCSTGAVGSGGGAIYLSNGERDVAVVVTPLGATRVHSHGHGAGSWSQ